jgi:hypothetical protein
MAGDQATLRQSVESVAKSVNQLTKNVETIREVLQQTSNSIRNDLTVSVRESNAEATSLAVRLHESLKSGLAEQAVNMAALSNSVQSLNAKEGTLNMRTFVPLAATMLCGLYGISLLVMAPQNTKIDIVRGDLDTLRTTGTPIVRQALAEQDARLMQQEKLTARLDGNDNRQAEDVIKLRLALEHVTTQLAMDERSLEKHEDEDHALLVASSAAWQSYITQRALSSGGTGGPPPGPPPTFKGAQP